MSDSNLPALRIPAQSLRLPDGDQWQYRFEIHSETSDRVYVVSQNKKKKHWACSCPAYRTRRTCKHLIAIGLPTHEKPYEVQISGGRE